MTNHLLIIDPQNDFCDLPPAWCPATPQGVSLAPALAVPGAHADMQRLAALIDAAGEAFADITLTLDSHQHLDIGHPGFWRDEQGATPAAFTQVSAADVRAGRFAPRWPAERERVLRYLDTLEAAGRYTHMIWPVHCEIGSWGQGVHAGLLAAVNAWEDRLGRNAARLCKGLNPWTEHYSAVRAEVPDEADPATAGNPELLARLAGAARIYVAGEAGSHCVKATVEHLAEHFASALERFVLIQDCISPVSGFEAQQNSFFAAMRARGMRVMTAAEAQVALRATV